MGTDAIPIVIESGKKEEIHRLSTRGYNHCFGLVSVELKFVYRYPGFDVISTLLHGKEEI